MIEAPEALYLSEQLDKTLKGKFVTDVIACHTPHKFAWFQGDPQDYDLKLTGKRVGTSRSWGGMVEIAISDMCLLFTDGINLRYFEPGEKLPEKHQLLIGFEDQSCIVASVRMYGGLWCFPMGHFENQLLPYYESAKNKPQVMSETFDRDYYHDLVNEKRSQNKSVKAFLATEQTVPGLGNGVLQDILFNARIHPKEKLRELTEDRIEFLFCCIKNTLTRMYKEGGRSTETDLFGKKGGYIPYLSKDTAGQPCPRCGELVRKENYLGGSIYYCSGCQELNK